MALSYTEYTTQEAVNRLVQGTGGASSGSTSTGQGTVVKAVARDTSGKQTRTAGQVSDLTTDLNENEWVREAYAPLAEDNVAGVIKTEQRYSTYSTSVAGTFTVKTGSGFIQTITILGGTAGAITVYDNTAGSGTAILPTFTPTSTFPAPSIDVYATFATGLTIVTAAATVIQVSYR